MITVCTTCLYEGSPLEFRCIPYPGDGGPDSRTAEDYKSKIICPKCKSLSVEESQDPEAEERVEKRKAKEMRRQLGT